MEPLVPVRSSRALCRITSSTASSSRAAFIALPACRRSESSRSRFESAAVRTRSSVRSLDSFCRCRSLSIAYTQNAIDSKTIPHRRAADDIADHPELGQIDSTTTQTLMQTSVIDERIHSWIRRCSTALRERVLKSRRPTIRASVSMIFGRLPVASRSARAALILALSGRHGSGMRGGSWDRSSADPPWI
jgi:hypothetical protein